MQPRGADGGCARPFKVGFAGPLTGKQADYGTSVLRGARLRQDEINARGGIRGRKLELVTGDDEASPSKSVSVAQDFASDPNVALVLGHFNSSCSNAAKPIYREARVPQVSYGSTNDDVCDDTDWTFRTPYKNSLQGRTLARFAVKKLGLKEVAIIKEKEGYGEGLASVFKDEAKAVGLPVVAQESFDSETTDYRPMLIKVRSSNPGGLLLAGFHPQIQALVKQARQKDIGITATFLAGDGVGSSTEYIRAAGDAAEGTYATGPFLIEQDRPPVHAFRKTFVDKYGQEPDSWAVYAYDAVGLAAHALEAVGDDRAKIRDFLQGLDSKAKCYEGLIGPIYFDKNGDAVNDDVTIAVVRDGAYHVVSW